MMMVMMLTTATMNDFYIGSLCIVKMIRNPSAGRVPAHHVLSVSSSKFLFVSVTGDKELENV